MSTVFAALLGYNPVQHLLKSSGVLSRLPAHNVAALTGRHFFPTLIAGAFHHGLVIVFTAAACMSLLGALVSLLRGKQFYYEDQPGPSKVPPQVRTVPRQARKPAAQRQYGERSAARPVGAGGRGQRAGLTGYWPGSESSSSARHEIACSRFGVRTGRAYFAVLLCGLARFGGLVVFLLAAFGVGHVYKNCGPPYPNCP